MKLSYNHTMYASFIGYIVQAIVNNFIPLLFLTFQHEYNIPITKITFLITFNFGIQLLVDLLSAKFVDKIGYRIAIVAAHIFSAAGLILLTILPGFFNDPFIGLIISVIVYAVGGGLIEVLVSPIVEACPTDNKETAMSLLHSFYCWGQMAVILFSTVFFSIFGIENWRVMAIVWSLIPILNTVLFIKVPILHLDEGMEGSLSIKQLLSNKVFWIMVVLMMCSGASEHSVNQWASTFAEKEMGIGKSMGDLLGPMLFAFMMGLSRLIYGKIGERINLERTMLYSGVLCVISYLMISLCPLAAVGFIGCSLCGFSVGILWPGTFSISSKEIKYGGTAMFALLALAGDVGCGFGPTVVGRISGMFNDNLKVGILLAAVFPIILILALCINKAIKDR